MKMIANRIYTQKVSLEEAVAKAEGKKPDRTLGEILAGLSGQEGEVKTASSDGKMVAQAQLEAPAAEAPAAEAPEALEITEIEDLPGDTDPNLTVEAIEGEAVTKLFPEEEAPEPREASKSKNITLKVAKKRDFRNWEAVDVVKAWQTHGSLEKCVASVKGEASDPKLYCGLLRTAASMATKVVKAAADKARAKAKTGKKNDAGKTAGKNPKFRKLANLTGKDLSLLREYWTNLYGEAYVTAMLGEYSQ
jgi:hypothetical protein